MINRKFTGNAPAGRMISLRDEIARLLILSMVFSIGLILLRVIRTGQLTFLSLVWNLFLGWLPYLISYGLSFSPLLKNSKPIFWTLFFVWLLFIPNSFYILTDLFHLQDSEKDFLVPHWFDLILIVSFAWNGLILGILSLRQMEKLFQRRMHWKNEVCFIFPIMWLNALGVYIGRYMRYNSWDLFSNPFELIRDIFNILIHPGQFRMAWSMILCFSVLLGLIYMTLKKIASQMH